MTAAWMGGNYTGDKRPMARVVAHHPGMREFRFQCPKPKSVPVSSSGTPVAMPQPSGTNTQIYRSFFWNTQIGPHEIPNIKSVKVTRGTETDVGTCTVEIWNCKPLPIGTQVKYDPFQRGYYNANYGEGTYAGRWGHTPNEWHRALVPDNLLYLYVGYGFDATKIPERDPHLVQDGIWIIVDVEMSSDGAILTVTCEDMMSLLTQQYAVPPSLPAAWYPLTFSPVPSPVRVDTTTTSPGARLGIRGVANSNQPWGVNISGHGPGNVLDNNAGTSWISVGNASPSRGFAYEWMEFDFGGTAVNLNQVRFQSEKTGYTAYLSIFKNGAWQGGQVIGYSSENIGRNGGNIPWYQQMGVGSEAEQTFAVGVSGVTKFRLTFGNLQNFGFGANKYRAGIREVAAYSGSSSATNTTYVETVPQDGTAGRYPGIVQDYSDVIRLCAAWSGFYWFRGAQRHLSGSGGYVYEAPPSRVWDPVLQAPGTIWGDIQNTGTKPIATVSGFEQSSYMEVISHIRDIVGFICYADATGALVWRMPNLFETGNWVATASTSPRRTKQILDLDERTILISARARVTGRNVREGIKVSDSAGKFESWQKGWNPNPVGLIRTGGWVDANFASKEETALMAEMIAVRQLFKYRTDTITIAGYPGIEIDDQVRVLEATTSEGYLHYVEGITSTIDLQAGTWKMELSTHWLGDNPKSGTWFLNGRENSPRDPRSERLRQYLTRVAREKIAARQRELPGED